MTLLLISAILNKPTSERQKANLVSNMPWTGPGLNYKNSTFEKNCIIVVFFITFTYTSRKYINLLKTSLTDIKYCKTRKANEHAISEIWLYLKTLQNQLLYRP